MSNIEAFAIGQRVMSILIIGGCFTLLPVGLIGYWKKKNDKDLIWLACGVLAFGLFFCSIVWPAKIEQYTETVTITRFDSTYGWNGENEVHFEVNGEDRWVRIEDGQRDMYEMVMGKEVILTYGRTYCVWDLIPICCQYQGLNQDKWLYGGIQLPDNA